MYQNLLLSDRVGLLDLRKHYSVFQIFLLALPNPNPKYKFKKAFFFFTFLNITSLFTKTAVIRFLEVVSS